MASWESGVEAGRWRPTPEVMERQGKSNRRGKGPQQSFKTAVLAAGNVEGTAQRDWDRRPGRHYTLFPRGD